MNKTIEKYLNAKKELACMFNTSILCDVAYHSSNWHYADKEFSWGDYSEYARLVSEVKNYKLFLIEPYIGDEFLIIVRADKEV